MVTDKTICCLFLLVRSSIVVLGFIIPDTYVPAFCSWLGANRINTQRSLTKPRQFTPPVPISYRLDTWSQYDNPEEGNGLEGDIMEDPHTRRTIVRDQDRLWPNGVLPYFIDDSIAKHPKRVAVLDDAMRYMMNVTCVKFRRIYADSKGELPSSPWVKITGKSSGCWSHVGRLAMPSRNVINLAPGCFYVRGHVIHELLHTLGVQHEHMRADRDSYIKIVWENIKEGRKSNFDLLNDKAYTNYGLPYDYDSVMHYTMTAFSKNKTLPTLVPLTYDKEIGQRDDMSPNDIKKLRITYKCDEADAKNSNGNSVDELQTLSTTVSSDVTEESIAQGLNSVGARSLQRPPYAKSNYRNSLQSNAVPYYHQYYSQNDPQNIRNPLIPDYFDVNYSG